MFFKDDERWKTVWDTHKFARGGCKPETKKAGLAAEGKRETEKNNFEGEICALRLNRGIND